ncbi:MAG: ABC-type transport auxiliary lipoprotein family protein [Coxiellaceae bacterium]|nr:ABC-type transport auxiliary lipoprotein family protein [Coxiellaceae bacterium]
MRIKQLKRTIFSVLAVLMSLSLVSCLKPLNVPNEANYTIKALKPKVNTRRPRTNLTLLVSDPVASPGYRSDNMRYMITPYRLEKFSKNKWIGTPANMMLPVFVQGISSAGYFKAVVTSPFSGLTDYNLQTDILEFEQNFMLPQSRFIMTVQADLVNSKTNKIQASRRFSAVVTAQQNDPFGGVMAANQAAAKINRQLTQFVMRNAR